ncbi:chemotaxis protein CheA [Polynucleobacter sp. UB-Piko-W3]|uniref:chemotaxis protein CheA n=1 Tax=Polynucleobacter sp. UB-Piko-W3 TaxID=1819735 RepID=UPI001C0D8DC2|nr:chemotaxis protein CheA [Polynucleobacter sp. UB-Piko-W3]MBU3554877.1 chemotaxis protein CheA [Polynucleobacter sp. UB-Piko-W3]
MDNNDQILTEFLIEAQEIFDQLDLDFVQLEQTPDDKKLVGNIFRAMHTLKGSSGFFAFHRLEKVAHAGESLLSKIRDGALILNADMTDALLETSDRLREIVAGIEKSRIESVGDDSNLIANLKSLTEGAPPLHSKSDANDSSTNTPPLQAVIQEAAPQEKVKPQEVEVFTPELPALELDSNTTDVSTSDNVKSGEIVAPVKVSVELLDKLMNLVSEMVLARNRLLSFAMNSGGDANFTSTVRTIDMVTLELQERMMKTRMQPISQVWAKFPRLVRDISQECGKKVELVQIGAETELDRTLLEGIRDPLVHIIRNSVDHGIELPSVRLASGKRELGTVTLKSMHENGMVVIEITDDGAGIDISLVGKKALEKGLVSQEKLSKLSDREIIDFIYLPGFSTKEKITNLSGRGVGMDVVRTNVQKIGGSVDISSSPKGTKLRLRIPLTLAIMPAVFVRCMGQRFAIPQNNLFEMVRHEPKEGVTGLEDFYGVPVFRLRNQLIPLLFLNRELRLSDSLPGQDAILNIVVVQAAGISFGLVVDEVLFMQEVVVKPLGPLLKGTPTYSGATILGDGRVAMILDIGGLAIRSGLVSKLLDKQFEENVSVDVEGVDSGQTMLLFDLLDLERIAIPLDYVDRLETFPASRIEHRGNQEVILYGDQIMKLIWLSHYVEGASQKGLYGDESISVVVHYHEGQPIGFVVKQIHDIVSVPSEIIMISPPQRGIVGSSIVNETVVSILNVEEILNLSGLSNFEKPSFVNSPEKINPSIPVERAV